MSEQRRCAKRGNSWVVPVPRAIRDHLGVLRGGDLYWHRGAKGEAHITTGSARIGGKPPGRRLEKDLAAALAHIERLERRLGARPKAVYNEGVNEGVSMMMQTVVALGAKLDRLTDEVRAVQERIPFPRRTPRSTPRRGIDVVHLPDRPRARADSPGEELTTEPVEHAAPAPNDASSTDATSETAS